jgi:HD-GYP domain-containing protein (c-di-GMP phosphodiesterase class II)
MNTPENLAERLEQLIEIGTALSSEQNVTRLLEKIIVAAKTITHADGGTLYRVTEKGDALRFEIMYNDTLGLTSGGTSGNPITLPDLPLRDPSGKPNNSLVAAYAANSGKTVNIPDIYHAEGFDFSGTHRFDSLTGYRSQSFLTVPMKNHEGEIIGVLQLINPIDPTGRQIVPFSDVDQQLVEALASQAAIALTNRLLIDRLANLFESFINVINLAIDEKSPYTGAHCQRVPLLTMMIAEAVNATHEGPFADYRLTEADFYELKIASMLHDCGKITTPVHVMDKATKLQTIFDRIELVDTRFEVIKRDEEIATLRKILGMRDAKDCLAEEACWRALDQRLAAIEADRQFLHQANRGSERMVSEDQERVQRIAASYSWRNAKGELTSLLSANEVENLTIPYGTLTRAEREVINNHIVMTLRMLERLPWPKHLKNVPEYAANHHERMDGKGFPRGLTGAQMSVPSRMVAIADVFEALTDPDRPYKKGMKLSQALTIMCRFAREGHIDPDLFAIFLKERVWRRYAEQFLGPGQIDVDEWSYPESTIAPPSVGS